jgi:signal peptidase I
MESTLHDEEYLLIDKLTYRFREPVRGEIIVFKYPNDDREYFIKRIIALPHETVDITSGVVTVTTAPASGTPETLTLSEQYLDEDTVTGGEKHITLGEDEYFVMGDNRPNSFDSRNWGPLAEDEITGLVRARLFPFSKINRFSAPQYE